MVVPFSCYTNTPASDTSLNSVNKLFLTSISLREPQSTHVRCHLRFWFHAWPIPSFGVLGSTCCSFPTIISIPSRQALAMAPSRFRLVLGSLLALGGATTSQATTGWEEWNSTCPPPSTTSLSFTQYDTVYSTESFTTSFWETATQNITVVQTVTQYITMVRQPSDPRFLDAHIFRQTTPTTVIQPTTDILVETATDTEDLYWTNTTTDLETQTQTIVQTQTTVSPTTVTASELLEVFTYTSEVTSLTICPTRITNPTFTAQAPYPSDWT